MVVMLYAARLRCRHCNGATVRSSWLSTVVEEEDEWLRGVHVKTGSQGLFPEAYVTGWEAEA